jgi:UDP-N-acetylglucosamine acyltransferase
VIHPSALIHPEARVDPTAEIGPYAVLDAGVEVGPGCRVGPHVYLTGRTVLGPRNVLHAGCVLGDAPQDLKHGGGPTRVVVGEGNVFREHVTVHRATRPGGETVIGSFNYLMQHAHVGHDCRVGDHVTLAGGALLAGHVVVEDRAVLSGNVLVHQFVRVGTLALMQGGAGISKDLAPYTVAAGPNGIAGLNTVGLRRAGVTAAVRLELRRLYHEVFLSGRSPRAAAAAAGAKSPEGRRFLDFIRASMRGVVTARMMRGRGAAAGES